ncbi:hypothetical protein, partial [Acidithiobacillus caldus]
HGATGSGLMAFVRPESVQELQKAGKNHKIAAPALVSPDFASEYHDQRDFSKFFSKWDGLLLLHIEARYIGRVSRN